MVNCQIFILIFLFLLTFERINGSDSEHVCGSIDIRNSVSNFKQLENCTVVEGYVQIVLIDNGVAKDYENMSFPKLREITDYLLFFRAFGLTSIGRLFPNLSVIRGNNLFHDYALVVFQMFQLQEIALTSLSTIVRGAVRIEKNPNLCYVQTIDWNLIAKTGKGSHFIQDNKPRHQCRSCGTYCNKTAQPNFGDKDGRLCWNSHTCQKICHNECEHNNLSCPALDFNHSKCCNEKCLGGCTYENGEEICLACKGFIYQNQCFTQCPKNTYEYLGRRCITEKECKSLSDEKRNIFLKPFNNRCIKECPPGYLEDPNNKHNCTLCKGKCPKICPSSQLTNLASVQALKGCTEINGSLEIFIQGKGENFMTELEKSFEELQEIHGFLKVTRSHPLLSLNFLKKLHVIHGKYLEREMYSFLVIDNPNLQFLWNWEKKISDDSDHKLRISRGKIFFHINPKLCYSKIEELSKYADMPGMPKEWEDKDVSKLSNGDKVACEVSKLNVSLWKLGSDMVGIKFSNFKKEMVDQRSLLGYLIYFKETKFRNVTIFDGRDTCESNEWQVDDYEATGNDENNTHIIPRLKPYTQYALYIKTYTIASERKGALSDIIYFHTKPDTPSQPKNLEVKPLSHSEILIEWEKPIKPNGQLTHYFVTGNKDSDIDIESLQEINHCHDSKNLDKVVETKQKKPSREEKENVWVNKTTDSNNEQCCQCKKISEEEVQNKITFEDHIINTVYIKKNSSEGSSKRKRSVQNLEKNDTDLQSSDVVYTNKSTTYVSERLEITTVSKYEDLNITTTPSTTQNSTTTELPPPLDVFFNQTIKYNGSKIQSIVISNLSHFTEYTIQVQACLSDPIPMSKSQCSIKAMASVRTSPLEGADDIDEKTIIIDTSGNNTGSSMVLIRWDEPVKPNGAIVSYNVDYKSMSSEIHVQQLCVAKLDYNRDKGYALVGVSPGNYSLRLRANTLAGVGNWTKPVYFLVQDSSSNNILWIVIPVSLTICLAFIIFAGIIFVKYRKNKAYLDYVSENPEYSPFLYQYDQEWEVERCDVKLGKELGNGSFGMVYEGELHKDKKIIKCAVKTVNENASPRDRKDFLLEAHVMKSFVDCHHVVKLLGIVSVGHPALVLMELMSRGDLRSYLRVHRPDEDPNVKPPTLQQFFQMAIEIADGMAYLASRKFVHRDLAARNCMVAEDLTVKIGDFGMTRDIYETDYYRKGGKGLLPVRWMAPESLKDGVFTSYSDVWSYGVVLWEMVTLASQPYQGLSNEAVLHYVIKKGTMQPPENCHPKLWELMSSCWKYVPKSRPTFIELIEMLLSDANPRFREVSYYFKQRSQLLKQKSAYSFEETTSLKNSNIAVNIEEDEEKVHFYPSRVITIPEDKLFSDDDDNDNDNDNDNDDDDNDDDDDDSDDNGLDDDIDNVDDYSPPNNVQLHINGNGNQTSLQLREPNVQSSEGSKGSKISTTTSNGSIANGHAFSAGQLVQYKTTSC